MGQSVEIVEEGEQLVVLTLADRIVLVVVALRAAEGETEVDGSDRIHAIHDVVHVELLRQGGPGAV